MDAFVPEELLNLLLIGITFSIFEMALVQKIKILPFFNRNYKIWILNLLVSFGLGIPFTIYFYKVSVIASLWVALFGFIGAPTLYETLKKQNIINYKPKSASTDEPTVTIPVSHEIK